MGNHGHYLPETITYKVPFSERFDFARKMLGRPEAIGETVVCMARPDEHPEIPGLFAASIRIEDERAVTGEGTIPATALVHVTYTEPGYSERSVPAPDGGKQ
jgi:hypothetical protein